MRTVRGFACLALTVTLSACGSDDTGEKHQSVEPTADAEAPAQGIEDFPEVPALTADQIAYQLSGGTIEPGDEITLCEYLEPTDEDIYVKKLDVYQGVSGHHVVLFRAIVEYEPGTIRECGESGMDEMMLVLTPVAAPEFSAAYVEFPEGAAFKIPAGTQLIGQYHYINTDVETIRFRDTIHLTVMDAADVQETVYFYGNGPVDFSVPPGAEVTHGIECDVPYDMEPLIAVPHMHHNGTSFYADVGRDGAYTPIIDVAVWEDIMRDVPPITNFMVMDEPVLFRGGDVIRTICSWRNETDQVLEYPHEMCASFGYFFSDDPGAADFLCIGHREAVR